MKKEVNCERANSLLSSDLRKVSFTLTKEGVNLLETLAPEKSFWWNQQN